MENEIKLTEEQQICRKIHGMKMHERIKIQKHLSIFRVSGGWLYEYWNENRPTPDHVKFVAWDYMDHDFAHKASYADMENEDDDLPF